MSISSLPVGTIHLLKSGQVISTVSGAVKELVENSLDAGATSVEVRLEDFGLARLEVRDNGPGVPKSQVPLMVAPHATSKLTDFSDLSSVDSYGFRGEALSSLCSVSQLRITTKTRCDLVASTFSFNQDFSVTGIESQAGREGTTVSSANMFSNLPVRRNYFKDLSRRKEELKKVEKLIGALAIINPTVRFSLHHNKSNIFGKISCSSLSQSFAAVVGHSTRAQMHEFFVAIDPSTGEVREMPDVSVHSEPSSEDLVVSIIFPKQTPGMGVEFGRSSLDKTFIFVNRRPVEQRDLERLVKKLFGQIARLDKEKYPVCLVSVQVGSRQRKLLDPNLEPNKQKVGLGCLPALLTGLETFLRGKYDLKSSGPLETDTGELQGGDTDYPGVAEEQGAPEGGEGSLVPDKHREPPPLVDGPCFTMIGSTQPYKLNSANKENIENPSALEKGNSRRRLDNSSISQFFPRKMGRENHEGLGAQAVVGHSEVDEDTLEPGEDEDAVEPGEDDDAVEPGEDEDAMEPGEDEDVVEPGEDKESALRRRGPVLKAEMFVSEELPGLDAVYINRLKDGDFTNIEDEDLDIVEESPRLRTNPYIVYESTEGNAGYLEEDEYALKDEENCLEDSESGSKLLYPDHRAAAYQTSGRGLEHGAAAYQTSGRELVHRAAEYQTSGRELEHGAAAYQTSGRELVHRAAEYQTSGTELEQRAAAYQTTGREPNCSTGWATGRITGESGEYLEPVGLLQPRKKEPVGLLQPRKKEPVGLLQPRREEPVGLLQPHGEEQTKPKPEQRKRKLLDESTPRIDDFLARSAKKKKEVEVKQKVKTTFVSFSISRCMRIREKEKIEDRVVGAINAEKGMSWLFCDNSDLFLLYPLRLKERMLYDRLLASHPLPTSRLPEPIIIHPGYLDNQQANTLLSLYTNTKQCPARITDRRLTFNGLDLVRYEYGENTTVKLEGKNTDIQFYGLSDLLETLDLISAAPEDKVYACRPEKVRVYLMNEATRIIRDSTTRLPLKEVEELLEYRSSQGISTCPHNKPVSTCLHELSQDTWFKSRD